ncbi:MAG: hypothetical protein AAFU49_23105 [Pseudomonadota bacterium]
MSRNPLGRYIVIYTASLVAVLGHNGSAARSCKAYRTKTKGTVERPYRYVREDVFLARAFRTLEDF